MRIRLNPNKDKMVSKTEFFHQVIIPSFEESGPLVGLEAMAAGKLFHQKNYLAIY